jgi:demethylmenaquinone methyltransferase/2-methoxy-6-polyprenyl-1,4-benzoquinol methylase
MSLEQRELYIKDMFSTVAPSIDFLNRSFSFGFDHFWRTRAVSRSGIRKGDQVLDVCTGTGDLAFILSRRVGPEGSVMGTDFCTEMLDVAKLKIKSRHRNVSFTCSDTKKLPFPDNSFDAVTVAFGMRNIPDTSSALKEIKRVLKPGGKYVCLELTRPHASWFRKLYDWYSFRIMPFFAKFIVKTAKPYVYLPRSINAFYPPHEFRQIIAESGFSDVTVHSLTMGIATIYQAVKHAQDRHPL